MLISLRDQLITGIDNMLDLYDNLYIPWVVGNHSRTTMKPRAKGRVRDNYEWLLGKMLEKHYEKNTHIRFDVSESTDVSFNVYNTKFLMTHGDQFRGGSGISGYFSPLFIGQARKQRRQMAINRPFDVMVLAHFHQYIHTESLIVNGSMIGMNEYGWLGNFPYEPPKQAFFICHPRFGITYRMPILCR
jgi:hypothetical protein